MEPCNFVLAQEYLWNSRSDGFESKQFTGHFTFNQVRYKKHIFVTWKVFQLILNRSVQQIDKRVFGQFYSDSFSGIGLNSWRYKSQNWILKYCRSKGVLCSISYYIFIGIFQFFLNRFVQKLIFFLEYLSILH